VTIPVRPATSADAAAIAATFEVDPPDETEFARRMSARPRLPWFVAESAGVVLGFAYAARHRERAAYRWAVDVSVYLGTDAQGRGIGRSLYQQLLPAVASLGYVSAFAGIALPNAASVGFHEALGFSLVGIYRDVGYKLGRWRDVGWYQLRLVDPLPAEPVEPREWVP
jgi:phosphinothricin acetyltransferase